MILLIDAYLFGLFSLSVHRWTFGSAMDPSLLNGRGGVEYNNNNRKCSFKIFEKFWVLRKFWFLENKCVLLNYIESNVTCRINIFNHIIACCPSESVSTIVQNIYEIDGGKLILKIRQYQSLPIIKSHTKWGILLQFIILAINMSIIHFSMQFSDPL